MVVVVLKHLIVVMEFVMKMKIVHVMIVKSVHVQTLDIMMIVQEMAIVGQNHG